MDRVVVSMCEVGLPVDNSEERATAQASATTGLPHAEDSVTATVLRVFDDEGTVEKTSVK